MKNELVQFSVVESAVREAYEKGRRSVVEDIRTAPGLNGSAAKVLGVLENRIEKAWDESLHPRDRNGRFVTKQEIDKYAHTPQGRTYLLNRVPPSEQGKMRAAIGAALREKKHGFPNVRHPERGVSKVKDPFLRGQLADDQPLTPAAQDAAGKIIKAQQLAVAVMAGKMRGDIPGMAEKLGGFLEKLPFADLFSLRHHMGLEYASLTPHEMAAKMMNAPAPEKKPVGGKAEPVAKDKQDAEWDKLAGQLVGDEDHADVRGLHARVKTGEDLKGLAEKVGAMKLAAATGLKAEDIQKLLGPGAKEQPKDMRPNPDLEDAFGMKTVAQRRAEGEKDSFWDKPAIDASKPTTPAEKPKESPKFGPWTADDLKTAAQPLRKEMEAATDPEDVHRAINEYGEWLKQFSPEELDGLREGLGIAKPDHETAVAASKLAKVALGFSSPSQGHTGLVHNDDGSQTKFHEGVAVEHTPEGGEKVAPTPETPAADVKTQLDEAVTKPSTVDEIAGHFRNPTDGMRNEKLVRSRLADRLRDHEQLKELATKVFGRNIAEHLPGTEQRDYLLDKLAEHARLRAESTHGRVESKNDPRMQAERLKLAHESMSKLFRDKNSPFKNDFRAQDLWSGQRAEYAKQMERHLQKHPELREEFGKYTSIHDANPPPVDMTNRPANWVKRDEHGNPILSDAEKERRAKLSQHSEDVSHAANQVDVGRGAVGEHRERNQGGEVEGAGGGDSVQRPGGGEESGQAEGKRQEEVVHPADDEIHGSAMDTGITEHGTFKHRPGEGALTARRQGKKHGVQWETKNGELRHSLHDTPEDAKTQSEIMARDENVVPESVKTIQPGELNARPKKPTKGTYGNPAIRSGTVAREVMRSGGLNPDAFERVFGSVKDAIENGVPKAVFYPNGKKGTGHLDTMAKELIGDGHLSPTDDSTHEHEHLLNALSGGKLTPEGMMQHGEKLAREHEREKADAERIEHERKQQGLDFHDAAEIAAAGGGDEAAPGVAGEGAAARGTEASGGGQAQGGGAAGPVNPSHVDAFRRAIRMMHNPGEARNGVQLKQDVIGMVAQEHGVSRLDAEDLLGNALDVPSKPSPDVSEPVESGPRDMFGKPLPKQFTSKRGQQITMDDAYRERDRSGEPGTQAGTVADLPAASGDLFQRENADVSAPAAKEPHEMTRDRFVKQEVDSITTARQNRLREIEREISQKWDRKRPAGISAVQDFLAQEKLPKELKPLATAWSVAKKNTEVNTAGDERTKAIVHRRMVENALAAGKPVPPNVLAEYPDLAPKPAASKPVPQPVVKEPEPWQQLTHPKLHGGRLPTLSPHTHGLTLATMGPGTEKKLGLAAIRNAGQGKQGEKVKDAVNAAIAVSMHRHDTLPQTFAAVGEAIKALRAKK